MANAIVGTPKPYLLVAKSGDVVVDLGQFPTALTNVVWSVSDADVAAVNVTVENGSAAELTFSAPGVVDLTVAATNVDGAVIEKSVSVTGEIPAPIVDALDIVEG